MLKPRVIAVMNPAGGTTKTTVTVNLAAALAEMGKKVLLVDLTSTDSLGYCYGLKESEIVGRPVQAYFEHVSWEDVEATGIKDVAILRPHTGRDVMLPVVPSLALAKMMSDVPEDQWDYVLFDTPNSICHEHYLAMGVATDVLIPIVPDHRMETALETLMGAFEEVRTRDNPQLRLLGLVISRIFTPSKYDKEFHNEIASYHDSLFKTEIRKDIAILQSQTRRIPVIKSRPRSRVSEDYRSLAQELVERVSRLREPCAIE